MANTKKKSTDRYYLVTFTKPGQKKLFTIARSKKRLGKREEKILFRDASDAIREQLIDEKYFTLETFNTFEEAQERAASYAKKTKKSKSTKAQEKVTE